MIRRGWRIQDKRVKPGCTDFYADDVDGNKLSRYCSMDHASLTDHVTPVARPLRMALGPGRKIVLAFDRGRSFATERAGLRTEGFECETCEREPSALLASTAFTRTLTLDDEESEICEDRQRTLRAQRGRVRRIAVQTPSGREINVLTICEESAE